MQLPPTRFGRPTYLLWGMPTALSLASLGFSTLHEKEVVKSAAKEWVSRELVKRGPIATTPPLMAPLTTPACVNNKTIWDHTATAGHRGPPAPPSSDSPHSVVQVRPIPAHLLPRIGSVESRSLVGGGWEFAAFAQLDVETPRMEVPLALRGGLVPDRLSFYDRMGSRGPP